MSSVRRRITATLTAVTLAVSATPLLVAQQVGTISGRADEEAIRPYTNYAVHLMDVTTPQSNQIVANVPLDDQGRFAFTGVAPDRRYMVLLVHLKENNRVVCREGPYPIVGPNLLNKTDVNIDCGKRPPAALWWAGAAAGIAATIAIAQGCDAPGT